jgi:hypothetical protein
MIGVNSIAMSLNAGFEIDRGHFYRDSPLKMGGAKPQLLGHSEKIDSLPINPVL